MMNHSLRILVAALIVAACAQREDPPAVGGDPALGTARVQELERRARELARTDGCDRADQCATAPVGAKACGGPRSYLVYCKATTDEPALLAALAELRKAEEEYNRSAGIVSDCMLVTPPSTRLDGRQCVAATSP